MSSLLRMAKRAVCIHGHFYQPPRENPWIEEVEVQDSAAPFHDWNERIAAECYGPNGAARLKNPQGRISDIVNNYVHLSFNFGPTLLTWLERREPEVYQAVIDADARSLRERGHGNAIAQAYNHSILPLCSERDRRTQLRWGIADFKHRFHRAPEGLWLPETAADLPTLQALADEGICFTVLSPYQCKRVCDAAGKWEDASGARFDPTQPYLVKLPRGGTLPVFFYDGPIARAVAFGEALQNGDDLVNRLGAGFSETRGHDEVLTIAVDGETFGHHRKGGDEVLAAAIRRLSSLPDVQLVNLAQALELTPPTLEAEIFELSSWSCAHGVERWRSDCGCSTSSQPGWRQHWRAPLRAALDGLRDKLALLFEEQGAELLRDPWRARDEFISVLLDPERKSASAFVARHALREPTQQERVKALQLLEMQRQAMLMFTSCGWFFSEISGLETVQILKYAARALQLAREACGAELEADFLAALEKAPSNIPERENARRIYQREVQPSIASLETVAAHYAIASLVEETPRRARIFCHEVQTSFRHQQETGTAALSVARVEVKSLITQERVDLTTCVLHFSGADFRCGVRHYDAERFAKTATLLEDSFARFSLAQSVREIDKEFPGRDYTLRDLFLDERRQVANKLLRETMARYESDYRHIFDNNRRLIDFLREIDSPVPRPLQVAADVAMTHEALEIARRLQAATVEPVAAQAELLALAKLAARLGARIDADEVRVPIHAAVRAQFDKALAGRAEAAQQTADLLGLARHLDLHLDLWPLQNALWEAVRAGTHDRTVLTRLAGPLWFDEAALLARLDGLPRRATA
jgi:alpha-amylase/alpha-mannosidase (GH57 family)